MKKFIYISTILAATALTSVSCKNEEKDLFDQSAAERTEAVANDYMTALTADGGKWVMDYFTNENECGYTYVLTFKNDGTVTFTGNNKWIGGTVKSETSLWEVISDNGPVLTFNSYNTIFHVFSTPENFVDPEWPSSHTDDVDEQGYGHEGDYEFVLMSRDDNSIRLKGKKYGFTIMLRRLPADTDDVAYLTQVDEQKTKLFCDKFSSLVITDATGEQFIMEAAESETYNNNGRTSCGVYTIYPAKGDKITQNVTANAIVTAEGLRFAKEVSVPRADASAEPLKIQAFNYNSENGTLVSEDNSVVITAMSLSSLLANTIYSWEVDTDNLGGKFVDAYAAAAQGMHDRYKGRRDLSDICYSANMYDGVMTNNVIFYGGNAKGTLYTDVKITDDNTVSIAYNGNTEGDNATTFINAVPALKTFLDMLSGENFKLSASSLINPKTIKVTCADNANDYFYVTIVE